MEGTICYLDSNMMCNIKNYIEKFSFVAEADLQMNVHTFIITLYSVFGIVMYMYTSAQEFIRNPNELLISPIYL